jgi:eukaryotic-like serine/threonine-protein kinase
MSLTSGSRLGSYEIGPPLGAGGMGEVYRATDTKLGRQVAIKVLPDLLVADPDRAARFEREARLLASLNHPHIAAIHGLEEAGDRKFLVMELVPGDTLAERIARGAMPLDEALPVARQIAEALEAAHEKDIIHRDLKPANIKVTADGHVKVLDFGLAKALDAGTGLQAGRSAGLSHSPTLSLAATNAGVILGTAAYMSPEQAKAQTVDRRSDLFAFGAVLYEMLAGTPAFAGDSVAEILAAVMKSEPDWSRLPPDTPSSIRRLLRRCLQKDRTARLQSAGDARIEINEARSEERVGDGLQTVSPGLRGVPPAGPVRERIFWVAALACTVLVAATFEVLRFRAAIPAETRVDIVTPATPDPISFAISPDGRRVVFVAPVDGMSRLWLRPLDVSSAQPIAGTDGATYPFWSPDSRSIGFFAGGKLKRLDIGGVIQTLADAPSGRGGTWTRDGAIVFSPSGGTALLRMSASGGQVVPLTKLNTPRENSHRFPYAIPDGRHLLYYVQAGGETPDVQGIYLSAIDGSQPRRLTAADTAGIYAPPGWLLFVRQGALVARRLDIAGGVLVGDPVTLADPVGLEAGLNVGAFSASAAGDIMYRTGGATRRQLTWFDRSGKLLGVLGAVDQNALNHPDLAPDGHRVAVDRNVQNNTDVWLLDGNRMTRFTFDASTDHWPIWSPDGKWIAFDSTRKGSHDLYMKPSNGEADEQLLVESSEGKGAMDWSPDGRYVLYASQAPMTAFDLWTIPVQGDRKPQVFLRTRFDETMGQFSPDGRWVAYQSNESGQFQINVRPFPGPGAQWQISTGGGIAPRWRRDGRELYYIAPDGWLMAAAIVANGATIEPGAPTMLFDPRIVNGGTYAARLQYAVAADGGFLVNVVAQDTASPPITLVQHWNPESK